MTATAAFIKNYSASFIKGKWDRAALRAFWERLNRACQERRGDRVVFASKNGRRAAGDTPREVVRARFGDAPGPDLVARPQPLLIWTKGPA